MESTVIESQNIPKIIHYCWFGRKKLPGLAKKCIASWQKFLPDYKIVEWNEDNFDVNSVPYTAEAYTQKRYAFVSDYARYWILYNHGGLYFDTDVEILRSITDIIEAGEFLGCETIADDNIPLYVAPGLGMGMLKGNNLCHTMLDLYSSLHFINDDGKDNLKTIVQYTTEYLEQKGLNKVNDIQCVDGIWIYPKEYFNPYDYDAEELQITEFTRSIHHFAGSWLTPKERIKRYIEKKFGTNVLDLFVKINQCLKRAK